MRTVKFKQPIETRIEAGIIKQFGSMENFLNAKVVSYPTLQRARKGQMTFATKKKLEDALGITFDDLMEGA